MDLRIASVFSQSHYLVTVETSIMIASLLTLAIAATVAAQVPTGYRTVYISSFVDTKFVVVPKSPTSGSTVVVLVSLWPSIQSVNTNLFLARLATASQNNSGILKTETL